MSGGRWSDRTRSALVFVGLLLVDPRGAGDDPARERRRRGRARGRRHRRRPRRHGGLAVVRRRGRLTATLRGPALGRRRGPAGRRHRGRARPVRAGAQAVRAGERRLPRGRHAGDVPGGRPGRRAAASALRLPAQPAGDVGLPGAGRRPRWHRLLADPHADHVPDPARRPAGRVRRACWSCSTRPLDTPQWTLSSSWARRSTGRSPRSAGASATTSTACSPRSSGSATRRTAARPGTFRPASGRRRPPQRAAHRAAGRRVRPAGRRRQAVRPGGGAAAPWRRWCRGRRPGGPGRRTRRPGGRSAGPSGPGAAAVGRPAVRSDAGWRPVAGGGSAGAAVGGSRGPSGSRPGGARRPGRRPVVGGRPGGSGASGPVAVRASPARAGRVAVVSTAVRVAGGRPRPPRPAGRRSERRGRAAGGPAVGRRTGHARPDERPDGRDRRPVQRAIPARQVAGAACSDPGSAAGAARRPDPTPAAGRRPGGASTRAVGGRSAAAPGAAADHAARGPQQPPQRNRPALAGRSGTTTASSWRRATELHWQGQLQEAESAYREIIGDRTRVIGPEHPDTLAARDQHATVLRDLDRLGEALIECEDVLAARTRSLGQDHPGLADQPQPPGDDLPPAGRAAAGRGRAHAGAARAHPGARADPPGDADQPVATWPRCTRTWGVAALRVQHGIDLGVDRLRRAAAGLVTSAGRLRDVDRETRRDGCEERGRVDAPRFDRCGASASRCPGPRRRHPCGCRGRGTRCRTAAGARPRRLRCRSRTSPRWCRWVGAWVDLRPMPRGSTQACPLVECPGSRLGCDWRHPRHPCWRVGEGAD